MTRTHALRVLASLALVFVLASCGDDARTIEVIDAQFRTTPNDLGAGYLTITNGTDDAVTLVGASSPDVERIELHESTMTDGVMQMAARPEGFEIGAGEKVLLESGGEHLMLFGPHPQGDKLEITLDFGSEQIEILATFDEAGSASSDETDTE